MKPFNQDLYSDDCIISQCHKNVCISLYTLIAPLSTPINDLKKPEKSSYWDGHSSEVLLTQLIFQQLSYSQFTITFKTSKSHISDLRCLNPSSFLRNLKSSAMLLFLSALGIRFNSCMSTSLYLFHLPSVRVYQKVRPGIETIDPSTKKNP